MQKIDTPNAVAKYAIFPLLLVIAIDCMGYGFIFPVLTPMFLHAHNALLPAGMSAGVSDLIYGVIVAVYPLCMFFGAPLLGDLSDSIGRKKVLFICLSGTFLGYLVSGIGVSTNSVFLLIAGRVIDGITAGSLPMAQAAIADVSTNSTNQAKYMGLMMLAIAAGQVLGPLFAGVLSDPAISSYFNSATPFYFASAISILNIIWLSVVFKETNHLQVKRRITLTKTLTSFVRLFDSKQLTLLTIIFLAMQLSWSFYSQASPAYLGKIFHYDNFQLGLFSGSLGIFIAVGGSVIMPILAKRVSLSTGGFLALSLMAMGLCIGFIEPNQVLFWSGLVINTIGAALAFSFIVTLFSQQVDATRQGWVMGLTGAIIALAWATTALFTGLLMSISSVLALWLALLAALIGCYYMHQFKKSSFQPKKP